MSRIFAGRCQCGAVRYALNGTPLTVFACHCTDCQRQSGSAFGMALWIKDWTIALLDGEVRTWVRRMPSGREMECRFCPACGTRLFHRVLGQAEILSIKPGTLDDTRGLQPAGHIWTRSAQPWFYFAGDDLQYAGNPDSFAELIAAWQEDNPG
jgi:hypothetical protein